MTIGTIPSRQDEIYNTVLSEGQRLFIQRFEKAVPYILLSISFFLIFNGIKPGYRFSAANIYLYQPPFNEIATQEDKVPVNFELWDVATQFHPWLFLARKDLSEGYFPFWNPYSACGQPLFSNAQAGILFPLNWLIFLTPISTAIALKSALCLWIAGFGMFLFLRANKLTVPSAFIGASAWLLFPKLVIFIQFSIGEIFCFLPFLLFYTQRNFEVTDFKKVALFSLMVASIFSLGHLESIAICLFVSLLWFVILVLNRLLAMKEKKAFMSDVLKRFTIFCLAMILGCLLVSVQLFPFYSYLRESLVVSYKLSSHATDWYYLPIPTLLTSIFPSLFGVPHDQIFFGNVFIKNQVFYYDHMIAFSGCLILCFALVGLWRGSYMLRLYSFLFLITTIGIVESYGGQPACWLYSAWATYAAFRHSLATFLTGFGLAGFAGLGFEVIYLKTMLGSKRKKFIGISCLAGVALSLVGIVFVLFYPSIAKTYFKFLLPCNPASSETLISGLSNKIDWVLNYLVWDLIFWLITFIWFLILVMRKKVLFWSIAVSSMIIGIDLGRISGPYNTWIPRNQIFPAFSGLELLQRLTPLNRLLTSTGTLIPNSPSVYGIHSFSSYDAIELKHSQHYLYNAGMQQNSWRKDIGKRYLLDIANAGLIMDSEQIPNTVLIDPKSNIYRNRQAIPRCYMVEKSETLSDSDRVFKCLLSSLEYPPRKVFLEEPEAIEGVFPGHKEARIIDYSPNLVKIACKTEAGGILVFNDAYAQGWTATINGEPALIYRGNVMFRVVKVPRGSSLVTFSYRPPGLIIGAIITFLTAILLSVFLFSGRVRAMLTTA